MTSQLKYIAPITKKSALLVRLYIVRLARVVSKQFSWATVSRVFNSDSFKKRYLRFEQNYFSGKIFFWVRTEKDNHYIDVDLTKIDMGYDRLSEAEQAIKNMAQIAHTARNLNFLHIFVHIKEEQTHLISLVHGMIVALVPKAHIHFLFGNDQWQTIFQKFRSIDLAQVSSIRRENLELHINPKALHNIRKFMKTLGEHKTLIYIDCDKIGPVASDQIIKNLISKPENVFVLKDKLSTIDVKSYGAQCISAKQAELTYQEILAVRRYAAKWGKVFEQAPAAANYLDKNISSDL